MRILIVEEALQDNDGHWVSYIAAIRQGLVSAGDEVDVLAHQEASVETLQETAAVPYLLSNCWKNVASQGLWGGLRHGWVMSGQLSSWFRRGNSYDAVMFLTMRLQQLLAITFLFIRNRDVDGKFILLFVQGIQVDQAGVANRFKNGLARVCILLLKWLARNRIVYAAETQAMQTKLATFAKQQCLLVPHPVTFMQEDRGQTAASDLTVYAPGFARYEKGSDLLIAALPSLSARFPRARFLLQLLDPFQLPDGSWIKPSELRSLAPQIELITESLSPDQYARVLAESTLVLLPYRRQSYADRVSRVAIEAAQLGKPMVVMKGIWAEQIVAVTDAGAMIEAETVAAVIDAITVAVNNIETLQEKAGMGAEQIRRLYSVAQFRESVVKAVQG